nr:hypothetical protein [Aphanizomenon flos-aquae]
MNLRTRDLPQKVKDTAEVIRLNSDSWYVEKIAAHLYLLSAQILLRNESNGIGMAASQKR